MSPRPQSVLTPKQFVCILLRHPRRWLLPALVVALAAGVYALVRPDQWEATQALIVRNEAANNDQQLGEFRQPEQMKTAQETILELAESRSVLEAALVEVGPPAGHKGVEKAWPGDRDVQELREAVEVVPPKGAEFGTTEVFYVRLEDRSRRRAVALVAALCDQLESRYQRLRDAKAQSMIHELEKAVDLAHEDLAEATARLAGIEREVGSDLAELRSLEEWGSSESTLRRTAAEIRNELRQAQTAQQSSQELLALLQTAQHAPGRLVATPNRLLESQPSLRRLKEGLVDAQLRTAELLGRMSDSHPLVQAAKESEQEVSRHLHDELAAAIQGVQVELRLDADRIAMLQRQLEAAVERLGRLAGLRADYANRLANVRNRTELLKRAEQKLADARVSQAGAKAASLIGRIDAPQAGIHPVGPGRLTIALVGLVGGLLSGLGTLLLFPPALPIVAPSSEAESPRKDSPMRGGNGRVSEPPAAGWGLGARAGKDASSEPILSDPRSLSFKRPGFLSFKQALEKIARNGSNGHSKTIGRRR